MTALLPLARAGLQFARTAVERARPGAAGVARVRRRRRRRDRRVLPRAHWLPSRNKVTHTGPEPPRSTRRSSARRRGSSRSTRSGLRRLPRHLPAVAAPTAGRSNGAPGTPATTRAAWSSTPRSPGRRRAARPARRDGDRDPPRRPGLQGDRRPRRRSRLGHRLPARRPRPGRHLRVAGRRTRRPPSSRSPRASASRALPEPGRVRYALTSTSGVAYAGLRARRAGGSASPSAEPPAGETRVLRVADETGSEHPFTSGPTEVSVIVNVPRGYSSSG